jgi:hypothetical protein
MTRLPFEYTQRCDQELRVRRLEGVARYFIGKPSATRVIGIEGEQGLPGGWWLPVQYEVIEGFAWQKPEILSSTEAFEQHLAKSGVEYVIVPIATTTHLAEFVRTAMEHLNSEHFADIGFRDEHFIVWTLRPRYYATMPLVGGGYASISYDPEQMCRQPRNGVVAVTLSKAVGDTEGVVSIEVRATGQSQPRVWTDVRTSGTSTTGPWMPIGGEFIFRKGRAGEIIGRMKVNPECPHSH